MFYYLPRQAPLLVDSIPQPGGTPTLDRILGRTRRARQAPAAHHRVLEWHDEWRNTDRILRWQGPCLGCAVQTWAFDDGENDPRGILGDCALWTVDVDDPLLDLEIQVRSCALCANDYDLYQQVKRSALMRGLRTSTPYNYGAGQPYQPELIEAWGLQED